MCADVCDTHALSSLSVSLSVSPSTYTPHRHTNVSTGKDLRAQILLSIQIEGLLGATQGKKNFLQLNNVGRAKVWHEHFELELILRDSLQ